MQFPICNNKKKGAMNVQNDRKISITVGSSRKAVSWQRQELLWSELCERLKMPQRTSESFDEYMRLSKAKQDDLKDVGGFVDGTLNGAQRKAANVEGRDIVALDLDNVPAGGDRGAAAPH